MTLSSSTRQSVAWSALCARRRAFGDVPCPRWPFVASTVSEQDKPPERLLSIPPCSLLVDSIVRGQVDRLSLLGQARLPRPGVHSRGRQV